VNKKSKSIGLAYLLVSIFTEVINHLAPEVWENY